MTVFDESGAHTTAHQNAAPMNPERSGPLKDIRVIDLTRALAGPYATMILADMGADVIKVEQPGGDGLRLVGPYTEEDDEHHFGGYYASSNRNKRAIALDLKNSEEDRETLLRLTDTADLVIENNRAGVLEAFGVGYEVMAARNPKLVYGAIRGFGDPRFGEGPSTHWPAYDIVAQSMGGLISHTGPIDGNRVASGPSVGDLYPATMMVVGVLGALHHAQATGQGQFVDCGMMDSITALCESMVWRYGYTGEVQSPRGSQHPSLSPFELFECTDGQIAIAAPTPAHWGILCELMGRPDMIDDDKFRSARRRVVNRPETCDVINGWTGTKTRAEVIDILGGRVPCGPVNTAADLAADPHVQARKMLVAVEHTGSARPVITPNTPLRFSETPSGIWRGAPMVDENRDEILAELNEGDSTHVADA